MSAGTSVSSALAAPCPGFAVSRTWPMCETSNRPAAVAGLGMLGQDAGRVLHRHLVAGEGHEARAQLPMQRVKRRALERAGRGFGQKGLPESRFPTQGLRRSRPPLSGDLKDLPDVDRLTSSVGARRWGARHFPETHPPAVRLPESFRGRLLLRRRLLLAEKRRRSLPQGSSECGDHRGSPAARPRGNVRQIGLFSPGLAIE